MPNAVVVATVVNTNMSEAAFRRHVVDQLRSNDRSLLDKIADADGSADVVTAVLNVDEFLAYMLRRFPQPVDTPIKPDGKSDETSAAAQSESRVVTGEMSEGEFMDHLLQQLEAGEIEPIVRFSDEAWQAVEDEAIGDDFSHNPFMY